MKFYNFNIIIEPEEGPNDGYFAYSPELPGCFSNGATIEETRKNIREAIELHLEALRSEGKDFDVSPSFRGVYKEELVIGLP